MVIDANAARISHARAWLLAVALFGSGFAALIYQVLWTRMLGLVFGVTVYAASTVLAAFMGGLALGSYAAGRLVDRAEVPLRWFAVAEIVIGATALLTPILIGSLTPIYRQLSALGADELPVLTAARFACSAAVLLVPTIMMGATLPFVLRSAVTHASDVGRSAAVLYAANTAGALTGALTAGYVLITTIGMTRTLRLAAALNLSVAALALVISRFTAPAPHLAAPMSLRGRADRVPADMPVTEAQRYMVLAVFAMSGFISVALEVVWIRALIMFLPATTYVFTTIVATVLGGIAAGSAGAALWRRVPALSTLAVLEAAVGLAALLSFAALGWTYGAGWRTSAVLQGTALAVLPSVLLMGLAFPIGLHYWSQGTDGIGRRTGTFYAANLTGAVAGALGAGFLLVPLLGARGSLILLAGLAVLSGVCLDAVTGSRSRIARAVVLTGLWAAAALLVPDPLAAVLPRRYAGEQVLWRDADAQSSVSVHRRGDGTRVLYLDGLHQANDSAEMLLVHRLIGTLAMVLHPAPHSALVVGLGGGATAGAVARFADASLTVVELSPAVVGASNWFRHATGDVLHRPNVKLAVDDGRNHLLLTSAKYDVITADIIQPFHAGAGSLYSREYFHLARKALGADGLMLQWIGHRPESQYRLIARTFLEVFPDATAWAGGTLLVGTTKPLRLEVEQYRRRLSEPHIDSALRSVDIVGVEGLLRLYAAGPKDLRSFIGDGAVLSDDRPLVEYFLSLSQDEPDIDLSGLRSDVRQIAR